MKLKTFVLPSLALGGAAMLLAPAPDLHGFSTIGGSLGTTQRDFRIRNTFSDPTANDNTTPDGNLPGWDGAELAIWKACIEWGSELHGTGNGDPHQPGGLGSGGANFDAAFQGNATGIGTTNNNIHSPIGSCSGGVLAFTETPISNGWRIRYCENWTWEDGPEPASFSRIDLQGVACHEYGHALGLGHTGVGGATMFPSISGSGTAQRSIELDDTNGVQFVYGSVSATKPRVTSSSVSGSTLTIHGSQFSTTNNEVWFTNNSATSAGVDPIVKVIGVSSTAGGTQIVVTVPASAGPGDILVKKNAFGHSSLSNAWPFDPTGGTPPIITGLNPTQATAVTLDPLTITIDGNGLLTTTSVSFDGSPLSAFTIVNDNTITFEKPLATSLGMIDVTVDTLVGSATAQLDLIANDPPLMGFCCDVLLAGQPVQLTIGAVPSSTSFVAASPDQIPSVLPGFISADIGNNFTTLFLLSTLAMPSKGWVTVSVPTGAIQPLTTIWFQVAVFDGALPLKVTNFEQTLIF